MRMIDDVFHVRIMGVERSDGEWGTLSLSRCMTVLIRESI